MFRSRRGLIKLAIETGAELQPCYVFGAADFYHNLITGNSILSRLSRMSRMGITMFFGQYGLPIPYQPRISMCFADPLPRMIWEGEGSIPEKMIDELHNLYIEAIKGVFEKYKSVAGYENSELVIL